MYVPCLQELECRPQAGPTGLVFSDIFTKYHCLWDSRHPECPERVSTVMNMAEKQGLLARCVSPRVASEEELLLVHTKEYVDLMTSSQKMTEEELKSLSESYDSIYIHPDSFPSACMAVGSVLQLVDKIMASELQNGFCVSRPPGHHAHVDKMNGYCMFNNLAIAARYAQKRHIVDVLYFSVHRYQGGTFWPHLKESDSSAVGTGPGAGYNINLPWNQTGMKDGDYLAAFQQLLIPVAYEFQPQLVLVAAGFDSVIGDPKGEMSASPQCFAVLTHMLKGLAQGRLVMALEGGYNLDSTAKGACACLKSLLGDSCPPLHFDVAPCESALQSISDAISALYPYWSCLHTLGQCYTAVSIFCSECRLLLAVCCVCRRRNAVAIVRPPGHHAEKDIACGFCLFNTVALTARYAQKLSHGPLRVLILDWDVHHGNGTQHIFEEDDR
uniref:Histone deacetylase domain-containing protein n=1 Tax=Denticeps clupeoides TaxID=299321 RepID=A0AAY4E953_9TELE